MIFEHYGFPTLERWPNSFFKEQLEHLMIAVGELSKPKPTVTRLYPLKKDSVQARQAEWMRKTAKDGIWSTCEEIGIALKMNKKTASSNIATMKLRGMVIKNRMRKGKPEYLLVYS